MKLDRVTFTGADDSIQPSDLLPISEKYPFVEWGILFGGPKNGGTRFPSHDWLIELTHLAKENPGKMKLCAHLCGFYVRQLLNYGSINPTEMFQRAQINFHGFPLKYAGYKDPVGMLQKVKSEWNGQFIFQCDGENDPTVKEWVKDGLGNPLFDTSSGAGLTPGDLGETWPKAWPGTYCGYAGGLGPDNVVSEVDGPIKEAAGEATIWIDMETKVFTRDQFDLEKCKDVLVKMEPFINA